VCTQIGLDKIVSTKAQVGGLQAQLTEMEPVLIRTQADVEALIVQVRTTASGRYCATLLQE
jgi:dynein heavy chain, axonemal